MRPDSGTYALMLRCASPATIKVGKRAILDVSVGCYIYIGSAFGPGGVRARVGRHCRRDKPMRWHIDYLGTVAEPERAWVHYGDTRYEHIWAEALLESDLVDAIDGFGCSDCDCRAHLFFTRQAPDFDALGALLPGDKVNIPLHAA